MFRRRRLAAVCCLILAIVSGGFALHTSNQHKAAKRTAAEKSLVLQLTAASELLAKNEHALRTLIGKGEDTQEVYDAIYEMHLAAANIHIVSGFIPMGAVGFVPDFKSAEDAMRDAIPIIGDDDAKSWAWDYADTMHERIIMAVACEVKRATELL
jgi:hypothetical protein